MKAKIVIVECKEEQVLVTTAEPEKCICAAKKILNSLDPAKSFKAYIYPKPEDEDHTQCIRRLVNRRI